MREYKQSLFGRAIRPGFALWAIAVIMLGGLLCAGTQVAASASTHLNNAPDTLRSAQIGQPNEAVSDTTGPVSTCVPITSAVPAALDLRDTTDGVKQQIESPTTYQIYGSDADTLRAQIKRCAPRTAAASSAEFTAETEYQLDWQYQIANNGDRCQVTQAAVGLHVDQIMPEWQPTATAHAGLDSQWDVFMTNLTTHENGHTSLDVQYAKELQTAIRNFPVTTCDQLAKSIKHLTDAKVAELQEANDNYDTMTNHGATQGAILPH